MLISERIAGMLNEQIGHEFAAMIQYVAIGSYFESEALPQLAGYFMDQAEEEKAHALRFVKFVGDTGALVTIPAIPEPRNTFAKAEDAVQLSLDQEIIVTRQINQIVKQAKEEADFTTDNFLQYFVEEQLEEVSTMQDLLAIIRRAGEANLLRVEEYLARNPRPVEGGQ